jgi:hypothetical protein
MPDLPAAHKAFLAVSVLYFVSRDLAAVVMYGRTEGSKLNRLVKWWREKDGGGG